MVKSSAALIMKNEEENLPRLLKSIVGKFDEIIVVDTGSTDGSIAIAKDFGCKVYEKEWNGFADARNFAVSKCSGEWIWHFDADFELEEKEFEKFYNVINFLKDESIEALFVKVKNYGLDGNIKGISSQAFIHRKRPYIYWKGNVHEELVTPRGAYDFNIYVNHYGYQKAGVQKEKAHRNLELIYKDLQLYKQEKEKYFMKLFYLFQTVEILSEFDKSYLNELQDHIQKFEELSEEFQAAGKLLFFRCYGFLYLASLMLKKKELKKAHEYIERVKRCKPVLPDIFIIEARYWSAKGSKEKEVECYVRFLELTEQYEKDDFTKDGQMVVIDYYHKIDQIILLLANSAKRCESLRNKLKELWKSERLRYFALILLELYDSSNEKEFVKLARKLERKYEKDPKVLQYLAWKYYLKQDPKAYEMAKKLYNINPHNLVASKILAMEAIKSNCCEEAIKYLSHAVMYNEDRESLMQLITVLSRCGYEEEAQKLKSKITP